MRTDRKGILKEMKELGIERRNQLSLVTAKTTAQKMKFSIKDFFSKCDQIRRKLEGKRLEGKSYDILINA